MFRCHKKREKEKHKKKEKIGMKNVKKEKIMLPSKKYYTDKANCILDEPILNSSRKIQKLSELPLIF